MKKKKAPRGVDQAELNENGELKDGENDDDEVMVDISAAAASLAVPPPPTTSIDIDTLDLQTTAQDQAGSNDNAPLFPPLPASSLKSSKKPEARRVAIPPHRMTPLKKDWVNIFTPLTEMLGLQVRMNVHKRCVEIRVSLCSVFLDGWA